MYSLYVIIYALKEDEMISSKRANFVRLAEARVNKAIKSIQIVANLSNRNNYEYSDEDIKAITAALQNELNDLKTRFKNEGFNSASEFKLKP